MRTIKVNRIKSVLDEYSGRFSKGKVYSVLFVSELDDYVKRMIEEWLKEQKERGFTYSLRSPERTDTCTHSMRHQQEQRPYPAMRQHRSVRPLHGGSYMLQKAAQPVKEGFQMSFLHEYARRHPEHRGSSCDGIQGLN